MFVRLKQAMSLFSFFCCNLESCFHVSSDDVHSWHDVDLSDTGFAFGIWPPLSRGRSSSSRWWRRSRRWNNILTLGADHNHRAEVEPIDLMWSYLDTHETTAICWGNISAVTFFLFHTSLISRMVGHFECKHRCPIGNNVITPILCPINGITSLRILVQDQKLSMVEPIESNHWMELSYANTPVTSC